MNNRSAFFSLVKAGLWNVAPEPSLFSSVNWNEIYDYSRRQTLLGIVLDGIDLLPQELRPNRLLYLKWCAEVLRIEDENKRIDKEVVNLFNMLRSHDVEPVLMKGQEVALNYPNPSHRACGDIDIYIGKKNYDKVNRLLEEEGMPLEKWSPKHMMYLWHDVIVENHRILVKMFSPKAHRKLMATVDGWHLSGNTGKVKIEGSDITVMPLDFEVVFLLLHSVIHLIGEGIGLRQSCDWAMVLDRKHDQIDREKVIALLKDIRLDNAARIFGALAVKYLGMPEEDLILPFNESDSHEADLLMEDMWKNGNFGFSGLKGHKRTGNWFAVRIANYKDVLKRSSQLRKIAPGEAFWKPWVHSIRYLKIKHFNLTHSH